MVGSLVDASDFFVEEVPLYDAAGEGGHTFVFVEKRLLNTEDVVAVLARVAGVSVRDVGYAGRKDRFGVTRQWLSVPRLAPEDALAIDAPGVRVLSAARHPHKLRTGQLAANRFAIRVRDVAPSTAARVRARCDEIARVGLPNRFGGQRYGRGGANVERARRLVDGRAPGRDRRHARFLLSALQAAAFDAVLAERPLPLDRVERGDLARRVDSGGLFVVDDEVGENERAARLEISATGPIFGSRAPQPQGRVADRERAVLARFGIDPASPPKLPGVRLRGARRPVRVPVSDLRVDAPAGAGAEPVEIRLDFALPPGSYATVLLEELFGGVPARADRPPA